ncbi:sugar kinase [Pseudochrobactrum sp. sp1633]|uniref:sugar kinase n=1 Tax=Pseudochrobactrum sp. sp1633 TaxID=3036706 RepID=UPI0025A4E706|nr:sugar kinase [Pseudochrobactrum sp. sp1633]MDM8346991.1 sugar kinase [Pseudochrobactrum sp. sp1633]HWD11824.1 sugar kinase [Pseudochrobactrum sp.]
MSGQFLAIGEAMIELAPDGSGLLRQGFAGDTFNAAYYARAALPADWQVSYFTLLGQDAMSDAMLAFMAQKQIGTDYISRHATRMPGLYMVHLNNGERSFSYWRSQSAARLLAENKMALRQAIEASDIIVFSGITLAILEGDGADNLLSILQELRDTDKIIAFDPNIRPRLWEDKNHMRAQLIRGAKASNLVLPSFDDEATCFSDLTTTDTISRYSSYGLNRIIVKSGADAIEALFDDQSFTVKTAPVAQIIDTTGAGDSFNGSFLGHFACTGDAGAAIRFAAQTAAKTIQHYGALVD